MNPKTTPPEIPDRAAAVSLNLLPQISRKKYETAYEKFLTWRKNSKIKSFSENILLVYFEDISKTFKASTLWSQYSMLRTTINIEHNVDISTYPKLRSFLKRMSESYIPKKSKILTAEELQQFLNEAPDEMYLLIKVAVAIGVTGACRREELWKLKTDDLKDLNSALLVKIQNTKTKKSRTFTVTGEFYNIYKKYAALRPLDMSENRFFINYRKGECTRQVVGINKFGGMAKQIATFLKLPNSHLYTGHCFRHSSATILVNAGGDLSTLKRHDGWRSSSVAENYIDDCITNKITVANKIVTSIEQPTVTNPFTQMDTENSHYLHEDQPSTSTNINITKNLLKTNDIPGLSLNNCSNFTINYNFK
ncbi:hypothetical protein NQ318_012825 [Aromia moschata]|uniref:Tyr recombinase domain-containing protein n=1 Tax=Aromia moschata TaxID=1265417 RepID=A0AAV8XA72_9CUCU|nr:hypothetical protein NQ318_012825 [Aromia moschata]